MSKTPNEYNKTNLLSSFNLQAHLKCCYSCLSESNWTSAPRDSRQNNIHRWKSKSNGARLTWTPGQSEDNSVLADAGVNHPHVQHILKSIQQRMAFWDVCTERFTSLKKQFTHFKSVPNLEFHSFPKTLKIRIFKSHDIMFLINVSSSLVEISKLFKIEMQGANKR